MLILHGLYYILLQIYNVILPGCDQEYDATVTGDKYLGTTLTL